MATLEVHDGRGRVERILIANDQPVMFGSSPKCDFVLTGEGVLPFHGRVRWQPKKQRFKVDASPEAEYLLVNGRKMASSSFRQGDEIQVGGNRIFMIHDSVPEPPAAPPRDDVTRVQPVPTPFMAPPRAGTVIPRGSGRESRDVAPPSVETSTTAPHNAPRAVAEPGRWDIAPVEAATRPPRGWRRLFFVFTARAYAPGQERVLSSPLVFGLGAALAVLIVIGVALYGIIARTAADRMFDQAVANLEDGDYRTAIRGFDQFLSANPKDLRAGKARVHRALANVRQYTSTTGASWTLALEAERAMLDTVSGEEAYRDSSTELGELVLKTGEALAEQARVSADARTLSEAEATVGLHQKVAGKSAEALFKKSRLPEKLALARAAVRKERTRRDRLAAMDAALKVGSSSGVYAARDALVVEYADQADDRELLARMTAANDLIRKAVTVDPSGRPGETEPHFDPLGPPTTLVLRSSESAATTPAADGPVVFALADGVAYCVDGATGTPLWQRPVGVSSPYPPQPVAGHPSVLAVDARHQELVHLELRTGALKWRQSLGGPVLDPPLVLGNQVIQATPAGKLLVIDLTSGAIRATVNLGMPLARTPVCDESARVLYVVAEKDCLFVLDRDPIACKVVEYVGHAAGSVLCPPARVGRYLIVAENHRLHEGRWRVFLLDEAGTRVSAVQQIPVAGWTWGTPASSGSVVWASSDRGGLAAYALGAYGEKDPIRLIARVNADKSASGPAFALARNERELLIGSGRSGRYELNPERVTLGATWTLAEAGPAQAAPQLAESRLVLTQQSTDGPGVALWGIEPQTGAVHWKTVLGAPWPSPPAVTGDGKALTALGVDGRVLTLSAAALAKGGFVESWLPRPGRFRLPRKPLARIEGEGWTAVVPAVGSAKLLVRAAAGEFHEVGLPAPIGAKPVAWGRELLVPGDDGRAYLIDPLTGETRAEPFVPPFDRTHPTRWTAPVRLGSDAVVLADASGVVRRLVRDSDPRPRLIVSAETSLGVPIAAALASTGAAVIVATADGRARALSARDLSPIGSWPLGAALASPPAVVAERCYLADATGGVLALDREGKRLWSVELSGKGDRASIVGTPAVRGGSVWFLTGDGTLHGRALEDGKPTASFSLGILPAGGPVALGDDLAIPVGLGAIRLQSETRRDLP